MRRKLIETIALVSFMVCLVCGSAWAVPSLINYQGKLTNASDCVLTGDYEMQFLLYDTETNGTALWGEQQTTTVDQGLLSVQLGRSVSFPSGLFDHDNLYLEMIIWNPETNSWETLTPRQRITSVAYAMKADHAATAGDADTLDGKHASELGTTVKDQGFFWSRNDSDFAYIKAQVLCSNAPRTADQICQGAGFTSAIYAKGYYLYECGGPTILFCEGLECSPAAANCAGHGNVGPVKEGGGGTLFEMAPGDCAYNAPGWVVRVRCRK